MIGNRHPRAKARLSLAEFTRNLTAREFQGPKACAESKIMGNGPEDADPKQFASGVVLAMSNPAIECEGKATQPPEGLGRAASQYNP